MKQPWASDPQLSRSQIEHLPIDNSIVYSIVLKTEDNNNMMSPNKMCQKKNNKNMIMLPNQWPRICLWAATWVFITIASVTLQNVWWSHFISSSVTLQKFYFDTSLTLHCTHCWFYFAWKDALKYLRDQLINYLKRLVARNDLWTFSFNLIPTYTAQLCHIEKA